MRTTWKLFSNKTKLTFLLALTFLFLFSGSSVVYAESALLNSKTLKCSFPEGVFTHWEDGKFSTKPSGGMSDIVFDSIDINQGKARMIGNAGTADVTVDAFLEAIHLTEHTISGTRHTVSIFDKSVKGKTKFLAVYSRHTSALYFSQYYGKCISFN